MRMIRLGGAMALALIAGAGARAQSWCDARNSLGHCVAEQALVMPPAESIPQEGSVTASAATATSGVASFTGGIAYVTFASPQLGRAMILVLKGTWAGSVQFGSASAANGCTAGNINWFTYADGSPKAVYTSNVNLQPMPLLPSVGATPSGTAAPVLCMAATVTSGSLSYIWRQ